MNEIELIEPNIDYADDIWAFRDEILKNDESSEDMFAGCLSLVMRTILPASMLF